MRYWAACVAKLHCCDAEEERRWRSSLNLEASSLKWVRTNALNGLLAAIHGCFVRNSELCLIGPSCPADVLSTSIGIALGGSALSHVPLALKAALDGNNVVFPLCHGSHFQTIAFYGEHRTIYIFDSLHAHRQRFKQTAKLFAGFEDRGWVIVDCHFDLQSGDGAFAWSCGLWTVVTSLLFVQYCGIMRDDDLLQALVEPPFHKWLELQFHFLGIGTKVANARYVHFLSRVLCDFLKDWLAGCLETIQLPLNEFRKRKDGPVQSKFDVFTRRPAKKSRKQGLPEPQKIQALMVSARDSWKAVAKAGIRLDRHFPHLAEAFLHKRLQMTLAASKLMIS